MSVGDFVSQVLRRNYWEMLVAVAEETAHVYGHTNDYVGFVLNPVCSINDLAHTAEGYMKRGGEFVGMSLDGKQENGEWLNYVLEAADPENLEWLVNYGEAKDLPASCFIDRQQSELKVNLLV